MEELQMPKRTRRSATPASRATTERGTGTLTPPAPTVQPRIGAAIQPELVHLHEEAGVKYNAIPNRPGYPSAAANLRTHLHVEVWVKNLAFAKHVWLDAHVLDDTGSLVHSETLPLQYARPAGDGGDVFQLDRTIYLGSVATPGSVEPRPDARVVEYRIYAEMGGRVLTDGASHYCYLRPDYAST
jgi:hypothetical protein